MAKAKDEGVGGCWKCTLVRGGCVHFSPTLRGIQPLVFTTIKESQLRDGKLNYTEVDNFFKTVCLCHRASL